MVVMVVMERKRVLGKASSGGGESV